MDLPGNACIIYFKCVNNDFKNELVGDSEESVNRDPYQLCSKGRVTLGLSLLLDTFFFKLIALHDHCFKNCL